MTNLIEKAKEVLGLKQQETSDPGFYLLPDRPIAPDKEEDIRFGHKDLSKAIFKLLNFLKSNNLHHFSEN